MRTALLVARVGISLAFNWILLVLIAYEVTLFLRAIWQLLT